MDDMNNSELCVVGSRCYEKLGLGMAWMTLGHDLKALDFMKSLAL